MPEPVFVSVIIPTHNRAATLRRTLDALACQSYPTDRFEVVLVADGCVDNTEAVVAAYTAPYRLILVVQPASGPGAARNAGAARATGAYFIFIDDDIEVAPDFVAAHMRAHCEDVRTVVLGYLPPVLTEQHGLFKANLRMWWEDMFTPMRDPRHRFTYKNLLSGNFSIARALFETTGGFDTKLRAHEDYDLGYRLLSAGARFCFAEDARGLHHEKTDARRSLTRKFDEGKADVILGRRYPELLPTFPVHRGLRGGRYGLVQRLLFRAPDLTMALATPLLALLPVLERWGLRRSWHQLLYLLQHGWYWRGVVAELPTRVALQALLQQPVMADDAPVLTLDLSDGLDNAEAHLDRVRPGALSLWHGTYFIGSLAAAPGTEGFRAPHLRPLLHDHFKWPLFIALLAARAVPGDRAGLLGCAPPPAP